MKNLIWVVTIILVVVLVVLVTGRRGEVDIETEQAAIRDMAIEWVDAANAKDVERMVSGFTDGASVLPPNAPIATGKEAIRKVWSELAEMPGLSESTQVTKVEVSRMGDLAYSFGTYESTSNDPEGNPVTERGKWVAVYKKQPDGSWKAVLDIWNSDQPTASE
jgi:uncharacterized protein (TIGR02246 family)